MKLPHYSFDYLKLCHEISSFVGDNLDSEGSEVVPGTADLRFKVFLNKWDGIMGRYQFKCRFRPLQYDFNHLELCLGKCCFKTMFWVVSWHRGPSVSR